MKSSKLLFLAISHNASINHDHKFLWIFFNIFMSFLSQLNKSCVEIWQYLWQCLWSIMVWPKFHLSDNRAMLIKSHVSYFLFWIDTRISWNEHDSILFVSYEILHSKLIARIIIKCSLCSCHLFKLFVGQQRKLSSINKHQ